MAITPKKKRTSLKKLSAKVKEIPRGAAKAIKGGGKGKTLTINGISG